MTAKIDEALHSPYRKMKDVDREVEYLTTEDLLKRKRLLTKGRPLFTTAKIVRGRDL